MFKYLKKLSGTEDSHEFRPDLLEIEHKPINPLGPATIWTIILLMLFMSLWAYFGTMDVVISARGIAIPDGSEKTIQYMSTGVIRKILVKDGDRVKKDQVLIELDPSTVQPGLESASRTILALKLEEERINALLTGRPFIPNLAKYDSQLIRIQQDIYTSLSAKLAAQLSAKNAEMSSVSESIKALEMGKQSSLQLRDQYNAKKQRLEPLSGIIPKESLENVVSQLTSLENEIKQADQKTAQGMQSLAQGNQDIIRIHEEFNSALLQELSDKKKQLVQLEGQIKEKNFLSDQNSITSPVDGYVNKILITTIGGVVTPAQPLMSIVPIDSPIIVKASVLNKDIGFVKQGMRAAIKIDTYSFQKYGMLEGEVTHVANSSIKDDQLGPIYEVLVTPKTRTLKVDGKIEPISAGMSVSAEIKVGSRRIIEFFIYPLVKYINEGMSVQ